MLHLINTHKAAGALSEFSIAMGMLGLVSLKPQKEGALCNHLWDLGVMQLLQLKTMSCKEKRL